MPLFCCWIVLQFWRFLVWLTSGALIPLIQHCYGRFRRVCDLSEQYVGVTALSHYISSIYHSSLAYRTTALCRQALGQRRLWICSLVVVIIANALYIERPGIVRHLAQAEGQERNVVGVVKIL
ncbi:hypothetical protein BDV96DRAFT_569911 [Lophiotrema nucula]|uniref:Uncharacterized protein n=1 Tax=Lophiotrema nucula TaxID=690887 RepID=A0A6A5ZH83_9PLEO|nr:hypothetical protein BDV96DRAFT_569911 [Lophiotrema nucula]